MPELPEVETVCRGLSQNLIGAKIIEAKSYAPKLRIDIPNNLAEKLTNKTIQSISRKAKYILIELQNQIIIVHLGMSGRLTIKDETNYIPKKHDHVVLKLYLEQEYKFLVLNDPRRFGLFTLTNTEDLNKHKLFSKLGLEPLSKEFTVEALTKICANRFKNIKATIMDASLIVGVGNIYACEFLFKSGIDPTREAQSLSKKEIKALHKQIILTLEAAIAAGGSTLKDYSKANGESGYFQFNFLVYGKENQNCSQCNSKIQRIVQSNRSTFYCATCQS